MLQDVNELSQGVHVSQLHEAWPQQVVQQLPQRLKQRPQCVTKTWRACRAARAEVQTKRLKDCLPAEDDNIQQLQVTSPAA
jgi:hypothetical protein